MSQLRSLRLQQGLTQVELASRLKRPQSYVAKIEGGERRIDVLEFVEWLEAIDAIAQGAAILDGLASLAEEAPEH